MGLAKKLLSKSAEASRKWRELNPERKREHSRKWAEKNKDKIIEYRKANKDKLNEATKKWKKENPEKAKLIERRRLLKKRYNMSLEDYDKLLEQQNFGCAICDKQEKLVVDHNHSTGKVRGLLCNDCNRNLIAQRDSPDIFYRAAKYLEKEKVA